METDAWPACAAHQRPSLRPSIEPQRSPAQRPPPPTPQHTQRYGRHTHTPEPKHVVDAAARGGRQPAPHLVVLVGGSKVQVAPRGLAKQVNLLGPGGLCGAQLSSEACKAARQAAAGAL